MKPEGIPDNHWAAIAMLDAAASMTADNDNAYMLTVAIAGVGDAEVEKEERHARYRLECSPNPHLWWYVHNGFGWFVWTSEDGGKFIDVDSGKSIYEVMTSGDRLT